MKFVQTFWTGAASEKVKTSPLMLKAGWHTSEYHWMSWALSCLQLLKLYGQVELVTDKLGKEILIDSLGLPYTSVSLAQEEQMAGMRPELFSLAKLKTYSLQKEPFIHVDGDLFLFRPLPDSVLKAGLVSSNPEADLFFNAEVIKKVHEKGFYLPAHLQELHAASHLFSSNAGIIGGHDLSFIENYTRYAFDFVSANRDLLNESTPDGINFLIEQISFFYLARQKQKQIAYVSPEPVTDPLYHDFIRVADIPDVPMVHAVGGCKRFPFMLDHLAKRLRLHYPEYYYRILALCREQKVELSNSFYSYHDWHIDTSSGGLVLNEQESGQRESNRPSFPLWQNNFERTIKTLRHILPEMNLPDSQKAFEELLSNQEIPAQVKDIFQLELLIEEAKNLLTMAGGGEELHRKDEYHYKRTSDLFNRGLDVDTDQRISISEDARFYTAGWNWWKDDDNDMQHVFAENFSTEAQDLPVAITPEVLTMDAYVYYLDALDAYVVEILMKGFITIHDLLREVSDAFEEDINPDSNIEYRYLIFDTVKRLAFNRLISFG